MALAEQLELELEPCSHAGGLGLPVRDAWGRGWRLACHACGFSLPAHSKAAAVELYWSWRP